jgi:putative membrane protein
MLLELFLALFLGVILGTITGITPGIHINLVSALLLTLASSFLLGIPPLILIVFLVSVAITHTFVDFVPSIFLGAPDEDNFLSILPGHQMLIQGQAFTGVVLTAYGGIIALILTLILAPFFIFLLPIAYPYAQRIMALILLVTCFFLIYFEKNNRFLAFLIFIISGVLGVATFNLPLKENLLPLFTGLFGISSLITSIMKKQALPSQTITPLKEIKVPIESLKKSFLASIIASPLCSFLPGLGSGQAAVIGSEVIGELNQKEFLVLLGTVNTLVTALSFLTLYSINKARTGVAVAVGKLLELKASNLGIIIIIIVLAGMFAFFATIQIAKVFSRIINKINYFFLSLGILILLIALVIYFSGWLGLLVSLISSSLGLVCILLGIRRTHLMGCLLIPALLFYI